MWYRWYDGDWRKYCKDVAAYSDDPSVPKDLFQYINDILLLTGVMCPLQLVIAALISAYSNAAYLRYMHKLSTEQHVFGHNRPTQIAMIKINTGVIRRAACHVDGEPLYSSYIVNFELFFASSDCAADWTAEYHDRCDAEYHLHTDNDGWSSSTWRNEKAAYRDTGPEFYTNLRQLCCKYALIIMGNKPVTESY